MASIITRKEALEQGLQSYFTGKPCKHGHIAHRWADGHCSECCRFYSARTFQKTKDERKEKRLTGVKKWREQNPIQHAAQHNLSNTLRKRLIGGQELARAYSKEIKKFYGNCPVGYQVDHIIPIMHPKVCGLHVPWNFQYLTKLENATKGNTWQDSIP